MICAVQREAKQKFACEACSKKWVSGIAVSEACFCLQIDFYAFRYFDVILEDESSNFRREAKLKKNPAFVQKLKRVVLQSLD